MQKITISEYAGFCGGVRRALKAARENAPVFTYGELIHNGFVVEKLKEAIPKMSEFDKGYILGKVEGMADEKKDNEKESEG